MASKNKDERTHVNELVEIILQKDDKVFIQIDRDAGGVRHTSSGWDFQIAHDGKIVYCEAKEGKGKLSPWQEFIRAKIIASNTPYKVIRFWDNGQFFTIDDGKKIAISDTQIKDFL